MFSKPREQSSQCGQAYLLFGISVLLILLGSAVQAVAPRFGLIFTEIGCILLPAVLFVRIKRIPVAAGLRWKSVRPSLAILSLTLGIAAWGVAVLIHQLLSGGSGPATQVASSLKAVSISELLMAWFAGAILPAICEEALFRGAIQGVLERRGRIFAVAITSVLFGLFHLDPRTMIPAAFLGVVFGLIVIRLGSTVASTLAHFGNNATAIFVGYSFTGNAGQAKILTFTLGGAFVVLLACFFWMTRNVAAAPSPLVSVPAAIPRSKRWFVQAAAVGSCALIAVVVLLAAAEFEFQAVPLGNLEPDLHQGQFIVLAKDRSHRAVFPRGVIVAYQDGEQRLMGKVVQADSKHVSLETRESRTDVPRERVTSVVVFPKRRFAVTNFGETNK